MQQKLRNKFKSGSDNWNWKGGRRIALGYVLVLAKWHCFANTHGYIQEHRLVWEEHHKAMLLPWGVVHHINHITTDNRIENLQAMMWSKHARIKRIPPNRTCEICNMSHGKWYRNFLTGKGHLCDSCWKRESNRKARNYINYKTKCDRCAQYLPKDKSKTHDCPRDKKKIKPLNCPDCNSTKFCKDGIIHSSDRQRYFCKTCGRHFS